TRDHRRRDKHCQRGDNTSYRYDRSHAVPPATRRGSYAMTVRLKRRSRKRLETSWDIMTSCVRILLAAVILALAPVSMCNGAEIVRVAVQKTGTFAWELAVIRSHGLDKQANLSVQVVELATPEAGKIALRAGNADIIVSDWLWVSRERTLGAALTF